MKVWFGGSVIYKWENGNLDLLVQTSRSKDKRFSHIPPQVKFPGGTNVGHPEEDGPLATAVREGLEETGLKMVQPKILCSLREGQNGIKRWFYLCAIEDCQGVLRQQEIVDGTDILSSPYWVPVGLLSRMLYRTHMGALRRVIRYFGLVG